MTEVKQLEQDAGTITSSYEHGSYCECIWCLEEQMQNGTTPQGVQREMEQEMTAMLKDLPLSIAITRQDDLSNAGYTWRCLGIEGKANSFVDATRQALQSLIDVSSVVRV